MVLKVDEVDQTKNIIEGGKDLNFKKTYKTPGEFVYVHIQCKIHLR